MRHDSLLRLALYKSLTYLLTYLIEHTYQLIINQHICLQLLPRLGQSPKGNFWELLWQYFYQAGWPSAQSINSTKALNRDWEQHVDCLNTELSTISVSSSRPRLTLFSKCLNAFATSRPRPPWCSRLYLYIIQWTMNTLRTLETDKTNFMLMSVSTKNWTAVKNALTLMSPMHVPWLSSAHQEIWSLTSVYVHERYVENPPVHPSNPLNKNTRVQ